MKVNYAITGMTCGSCVSKVEQVLTKISTIKTVRVQLDYPQTTITSSTALNLDLVNTALAKVGNYSISEEKTAIELAPLPKIKKNIPLPEKSINTYKPLILILAFISGVSLMCQYPFSSFSGMLWMRYFMAGFFIVFAFFKLLNLKGFASSYCMYDIIAKKWPSWGFIYPFIELILGLFYLINIYPFVTNLTTVVVLGISSIGVIESNLNNKKIKCACLGDVFNLPMSTLTIIEDLTMVAMAGVMLLHT